jgi:hypothetical protein
MYQGKGTGELIEVEGESCRAVLVENLLEINEPMNNLLENFFLDDEKLRLLVHQKQLENFQSVFAQVKVCMVDRTLVADNVTILLQLVSND